MKTIWLRFPTFGKSSFIFLLISAIELCLKIAKRILVKKNYRSVDFVRKNYDNQRNIVLQNFLNNPIDFDEYVFGLPERDFILLNNKIIYNDVRTARMCLLSFIVENFRDALHIPNATFIEFGCGDGRNLLYLKRCFPSAIFIGYELSQKSVELCRAAATHFNLDVEFHQADISTCTAESLNSGTICFSVHAIEQIPFGYDNAISVMYKLASRGVYLFEPVDELYPLSPRGIISRLRVVAFDRVSGILKFSKTLVAKEFVAKRLGINGNPLNESCLIKIIKP